MNQLPPCHYGMTCFMACSLTPPYNDQHHSMLHTQVCCAYPLFGHVSEGQNIQQMCVIPNFFTTNHRKMTTARSLSHFKIGEFGLPSEDAHCYRYLSVQVLTYLYNLCVCDDLQEVIT